MFMNYVPGCVAVFGEQQLTRVIASARGVLGFDSETGEEIYIGMPAASAAMEIGSLQFHIPDISSPALSVREVRDALLRANDSSKAELIFWRFEWSLQAIQCRIPRSDKQLKRFIDKNEQNIETNLSKVMSGRAVKSGGKPRAGSVVAQFTSPSPSTLRKWMNKLIEGGMHISALRNLNSERCGTKKHPQLTGELAAVAEDAEKLYLSGPGVYYTTIKREADKDIRALCKRTGRNFPYLSLDKLKNWIKSRNTDYAIDLARCGEQYADNQHRRNYGHLIASRSNQIWYIDAWEIDVHSLAIDRIPIGLSADDIEKIDTERRYQFAIIDLYSRRIMSIVHSHSENTEAALECLRRAVMNVPAIFNANGVQTTPVGGFVPERIVTDQGSCFRSDEFRFACGQLRTQLDLREAGEPQRGWPIERHCRTQSSLVSCKLPGHTIGTAGHGKMDNGQSRACLARDEVFGIFLRATFDEYNVMQTKGNGPGKQIPEAKFLEGLNNEK